MHKVIVSTTAFIVTGVEPVEQRVEILALYVWLFFSSLVINTSKQGITFWKNTVSLF